MLVEISIELLHSTTTTAGYSSISSAADANIGAIDLIMAMMMMMMMMFLLKLLLLFVCEKEESLLVF